jgi:hypothetical protein
MELLNIARVAQLVERQPSKLNVAGSNPVSRSKIPAEAGISLKRLNKHFTPM